MPKNPLTTALLSSPAGFSANTSPQSLPSTMKLILILLALCVGVVGIAAIVGSILPRDHVASMTATINASPIKVWSTVTDVGTFATWRPGLKSAELVSRSPLTWKEVTSTGTMTLAAAEFQPPARMVARITDSGGPFGGEWEYR